MINTSFGIWHFWHVINIWIYSPIKILNSFLYSVVKKLNENEIKVGLYFSKINAVQINAARSLISDRAIIAWAEDGASNWYLKAAWWLADALSVVASLAESAI